MKKSQLQRIIKEELRRVLKENSYLMQDPAVKSKVEMVINTLKSIDVDGETVQYILQQVGMDDQMKSQLSPMSEDTMTTNTIYKRIVAPDADGKEIKVNSIVELVDDNIRDGWGKPLKGNEYKVVRVNPKTITIEPTFVSWLRQVVLDSNMVRLKK